MKATVHKLDGLRQRGVEGAGAEPVKERAPREPRAAPSDQTTELCRLAEGMAIGIVGTAIGVALVFGDEQAAQTFFCGLIVPAFAAWAAGCKRAGEKLADWWWR